jgi:hypothetical protein
MSPVSKSGFEVHVDLFLMLTQRGSASWATQWRQRLRLDVESVRCGQDPLITLAMTPNLVRTVVGTAQDWFSRLRRQRVKVKLGDSELEVMVISPVQPERLIADSIACQAGAEWWLRAAR